ncbi:MAG: GTP pyrophosphokinase [Deltaproteobacteria bacterium]|jgi:putative GTP pyrophosphokinase|nr:GTP pyrophosphokinase [Deltaproteobacteria bacterium]
MKSSHRENLVRRANRFYLRYGSEVGNLCKLVEVKLNQLCIAYTLNNHLPREALEVVTRVKPQTSFIDKLERLGWPEFYYPTDIIRDLIGARVVCWFVDDCYGIEKMIEQSHGFNVDPAETEDFIAKPKPSGYRSIHLMADFTYDSVTRGEGFHELTPRTMACEIQIRTRLQDAFGQLTHDFPYKSSNSEAGARYQEMVARMAESLAEQDRAASQIRELVREAYKHEKRGGFSMDHKSEPGMSPRLPGLDPAD